MAKSIKCPTCATPIEVTPQAVGQVVKCPGCGRGIKLVAKQKPAGAGGAAVGGAGARAATSPTVSNPGESQRSYIGEPAVTDEPPRLDTTCEVCGKYTDEGDLVEDQGRLMCKECALSAAASRAESGPELAPPPYVPSRRGNLINFTPITFVFIFFGLLWLVAYLMPRFGLGTRPEFKQTSSIVKRPVAPTPTPTPTPGSAFAASRPAGEQPEATTQHADSAAADTAAADAAAAEKAAAEKTKADEEWEKANHDQILMRFDKANRALADGTKEEADRLYHEAFDFIKDHELKDPTLSNTVLTAGKLWKSVQAAPPEPGPTPGGTPVATTSPDQSAPGETSATPANPAVPTTPIGEGLLKLRQKDYTSAAVIFETLRKKMLPLPQSLTSEQQLILSAKAAADLGRGKADEGKGAADLLYQRGNRSRALVLNRAMIYLASNQGTIKELVDVSESVKAHINNTDELAANIYGTILYRLSNLPLNEATRSDLAKRQKWLDDQNDQQAAAHEGKLKWGTDWLPADDVKRYRLLKGSVQDTALAGLYRQLEVAKSKALTVQKQYDQAAQRGANNAASLKTTLDTLNVQVEAVQQKVNDAKQAVQPQRWLEQFEPVVPDEQ